MPAESKFLHQCRECRSPVDSRADACPACGCRPPIACSVCAKPVSAASLHLRISEKHPHGSYTPAGEPVCHEHRLVRCYGCAKLFPQQVMRRRVVGTQEDRVLRDGMRPRVEEVFGAFCPQCEPGRRGVPASRHGAAAGNIRAIALLVCGAFLTGLLAFFWVLMSLL